MTTAVETDGLTALIADARRVPLVPRPRVIDLTEPAPRVEITIPDATVSLVAGLDDYGS